MSLDVSLTVEEPIERPAGSGIFVREEGQTKEITPEEWHRRHPDREPVRMVVPEGPVQTREVFSRNVTHYLGRMAHEAMLYYPLWRPEEIGLAAAGELVPFLRAGLKLLRDRPEQMRAKNPENGRGNYEGLVAFVEHYLAACEQYPAAKIEVSR